MQSPVYVRNPNLIIIVFADALAMPSAGIRLITKLHIFPSKFLWLLRWLCMFLTRWHQNDQSDLMKSHSIFSGNIACIMMHSSVPSIADCLPYRIANLNSYGCTSDTSIAPDLTLVPWEGHSCWWHCSQHYSMFTLLTARWPPAQMKKLYGLQHRRKNFLQVLASENNLKPKSCAILFAHNLPLSYPIILKFCT